METGNYTYIIFNLPYPTTHTSQVTIFGSFPYKGVIIVFSYNFSTIAIISYVHSFFHSKAHSFAMHVRRKSGERKIAIDYYDCNL